MFSVKTMLLGLGLGAAALLAGCATSSPAAAVSGVPSTQALTCDGCKVTWVKVTDTGAKGHIIGYHNSAKMTCPDCKDAVENFFTTGNFQHSCSACGGNMSICESHPS
jgi:hypothetical protein